MKTPNDCAIAPDVERAKAAAMVGPFYVMPGRIIVDALSRPVLDSWRVYDAAGYPVTDHAAGFHPCDADANAHAVAHGLNVACVALSLADALRAVLPFAESRAEDMDENAHDCADACSKFAPEARTLADNAAAMVKRAREALAQFDTLQNPET